MKKSERCSSCGQIIKKKRSVDISTRFHGWITWMAGQLAINRDLLYFIILLKAIEIECEGGSPYPYTIVPRMIESPITGKQELHDLPEPWRTSNRTNKEMITACRACEIWWSENGSGMLPEKIWH